MTEQLNNNHHHQALQAQRVSVYINLVQGGLRSPRGYGVCVPAPKAWAISQIPLKATLCQASESSARWKWTAPVVQPWLLSQTPATGTEVTEAISQSDQAEDRAPSLRLSRALHRWSMESRVYSFLFHPAGPRHDSCCCCQPCSPSPMAGL